MRRRHADIAILALFLQRQKFQFLADYHAVRHPQRQAGADIGREGEKLHLLADLAMIAFFRFLEPREIGVELFLIAPGSAVDALQLCILGVAAPIGARDLGQLEGIADLAGGCEVRTAAEIVPIAMPIDRDIFAGRNGFDQFRLITLADPFEMRDGFIARPNFAARRQIGLHDLMHLGFDLREIFGRERGFAREVVIETIVDGRADGHLGARIERLHRHGEDMGCVVADQLQRFVILLGDDADFGVVFDRPEQVVFLPVHFQDQRRFGEARPDGSRDLAARHAARKRHRLAVGQSDHDLRC